MLVINTVAVACPWNGEGEARQCTYLDCLPRWLLTNRMLRCSCLGRDWCRVRRSKLVHPRG